MRQVVDEHLSANKWYEKWLRCEGQLEDLKRERDATLIEVDLAHCRSVVDWANQVSRLQARINELERGEYICKKCGLRKDSDWPKGDF